MSHCCRSSCRSCNSNRLQRFLSLGPTPLANSFLRSPSEFATERYYPLDVYFCEECSLVQLLDVVDPEVLFRNYIYVSGTSETIAVHNASYARTVVELLELKRDDLVVEVASNDGSLLKCFRDYGVRTLGVEPAVNIAALAIAEGIEMINSFFDLGTSQNIRASYGPAKVVIGNNVLAHVDQTQDFLRGCKYLLGDGGLVIIEVPYVRDLVERLEYDTIYHEHLCYFSASTLLRLCEAVGLSLIRLDYVPVHGGSLRMYAGLPDQHGSHASEVVRWSKVEEQEGLGDFNGYEKFALNVQQNKTANLDLLRSLTINGATVAGYGAPAKGNTFLNYCGIDTHLIPYTVDKSPLKVGLYTPGAHIPVLPVSTLLERQPDYTLILAWNFADEIIRQQEEYRARGGKFIVPVPVPKII